MKEVNRKWKKKRMEGKAKERWNGEKERKEEAKV